MDSIDAVKQVFTEFIALYHLVQVAVGGTNQTDVNSDRLVAAYTDNTAALQYGQ